MASIMSFNSKFSSQNDVLHGKAHMCSFLRLVIYLLSSVGKMKFTFMLSRLLQLFLSHLEVFNSSDCSKHGRIPLFSNKPLAFSWWMWNTFGWQKLSLFPCHTVTHPQMKFTKTSPRRAIAQEGALFSFPTIQGCEHLLATFQHDSVHTVEDIQTEWNWNFSFPFFLCFPCGNLILSTWNREFLWLYLDNSHAENLQQKGTDFLHKLLVQQLNRWLLPLQKIYSSKRQLFTKGTHKHIKQLGLKVESSREVQKHQ